MTKQNIYNYLKKINCCNPCCLRYLDGWKDDYLDVLKTLEKKKIEVTNDSPDSICPACLNLLSESTIVSAVEKLVADPSWQTYNCESIICAIQLPIILNVRQLSLWMALLSEFPEQIDHNIPPDVSVKDVFKLILNPRVCELTKKEFDPNGMMVNFYFGAENEAQELVSLLNVKPGLFSEKDKERKKHNLITRNIFEKHFIPSQLSCDIYKTHLEVPPQKTESTIQLLRTTIKGPTIFVAGRYCKYSRNLSQTPWVLDGKRMMEDSVQEIITNGIAGHFGVDWEKMIFSSSGREDVDVRCLGDGRPFVLEIIDAHNTKIPLDVAVKMESTINSDKLNRVTVSDLQVVKREELVHIKTGEENKKKIYRALCKIDCPITADVLQKLDLPDGFEIQQWTPLRVLHRRTLLCRPRKIFSVSPTYFINDEGHEMIIIDVVTQAGTYVKELVHGEFGRTEPSLSSLVGVEMDILALDVMRIDLDWPPAAPRHEIMCCDDDDK